MNINKHNYEEYFLLYADNELPAAAKKKVEEFVVQHPEFEEEFLMLQQSIIKPENIQFDQKKSLLKDEIFISKNNYEEKFILYTDGELNSLQKKEVANFASQQSLNAEFALFQKLKFLPDSNIVFPNKASLLKTKNNVKAIPLNWLKALAAAIILGFGLWQGINYLHKSTREKIIVRNLPAKHPVDIINPTKQKDETNNAALIDKSKTSKPQQFTETVVKPAVPKQSSLKEKYLAKKSNQSQKEEKKIETLPGEKNNIVAITEPQKKIDPVIRENDADKPVDPSAKNDNIQNRASSPQNLVKPASYKGSDDQKSDNYVFYNITQEQFNKSKLGSFFKKIKAVIERKNSLKEKIFKTEKETSLLTN